MKLISIIIPALNEERNITILISSILKETKLIPNCRFEIIFINDGSTDNTEQVLYDLSKNISNLFYISFTRNFGQQNALKAGYDYAHGDAVICMDADLQNPPRLISELITQWESGFDVALCKRIDGKQSVNRFKNLSSRIYYLLYNFLSENGAESNCPDFRLLDRKVVDIIKAMPENDLFLRGMVSWIGYKSSIIEYTHEERSNGQSNYTFRQMCKLAGMGITGFSVRPLHAAIYLGLFFSCLSILYIPYVFVRFYYGHTISGWSSLIVIVTFLGGLQLFVLGIIGLYLGKLFVQSKQRPKYIVKNANVVSFNELP